MLWQGCDTHEGLVLASPLPVGEELFAVEAGPLNTFLALSVGHRGPVAPDWGVGIALGIGDLVGSYPLPASSLGYLKP